MKVTKVAFIGNVADAFEDRFPKQREKGIRGKFSILKEPACLTMLVHLSEKLLETHADAIGFYLIGKGMEHTTVRGGGTVMFFNTPRGLREIMFSEASGSFGVASGLEVELIARNAWMNGTDYNVTFADWFEEWNVEERAGFSPDLEDLRQMKATLNDAAFRIVEF